jgi:hypothetical protein
MKDGMGTIDLALPLSNRIPYRSCDDPDDYNDRGIDYGRRPFMEKGYGFEALNQLASVSGKNDPDARLKK